MNTQTPKHHYLTCLPHHAPKIVDSTKTTTIRTPRKRPISVGDSITFRVWVGVPYRKGSTVRDVRTVVVTSVNSIVVMRGAIYDSATVSGNTHGDPEQFARNDGFDSFAELVEYLVPKSPGEFRGVVVGW